MIKTYTEDEVKELVMKSIREYGKYPAAWCRKHNVLHPNLTQFLSGARGPTTSILKAVGLQKAIVPIEERET